MDSEKKRRPISAQVQRLVLSIAVGALLLSGLIAIFSMQRIKLLSEEALLTRMEHTLSERVQSKALLADSELGKYAGYIEAFAEYLHQLYVAPEEYVAHPVLPPDKNNGGVYTLQRALASESLSLGRVKTEIEGSVLFSDTISLRLSYCGGAYNPFHIGPEEDELDILSLKLLRHRALRAAYYDHTHTDRENSIHIVL